MKRILTMLAAAMLLCSGLRAQQPQMPPIPLDPAVRQGVLPNGLTYYIRHNEWPEKRADFYIAQKVGSMQEEDEQVGLAHFLEHMCFNGTTHFPGDALKQYLQRIGVRFGENLNAYTSFDETVYNVNNVNIQVPGAIDSCLLILHDWSHDLLLEDKEIDKERGVINEEWRMRRTAMQRMQEGALADLFEGSKYANRMPIGTMEVVMNFPYETLRSYYRRWYRPDLQGLVIVGDVNVDEVEQKIKDMFADIQPAPADAAPRVDYPVQDNDEMLVSVQKDKEMPASYALFFMKTEAMPRQMKSSMAYAAVNYVREAVGSMLGDRFSEIMRQSDAPFAQADAGFGEYFIAKTKDAFTGSVVMKDGQYIPAIQALYREILRAQRFGFTQSEYDRFQQEYASQLDAAYEARDKVENTTYVNQYVRHFLDNEPAAGIEWERETMKQLMPMIPLQAINATMAQLPTNNHALCMLLPDKEGIQYPTADEIRQAMKAVEQEQIEGYTEEVNTDPLISELPQGGSIRKVTDGVYGSKVVTLGNGIRVNLLPTDYAPNSISMQATSWGGTSLYPDADYVNATNASIVSIGGWGQFKATELQKKLAGIQASVGPTVGDRTEGLRGQCVKKDIETLLQLTYLCFTAPHRDDEAFQSTLERLRSALVNQDLDPKAALQDSVASVLYGNDVRALRLKSSDVDKFSYDRILEVYGQRFANAADFEFYFVGDFEVDSIAPLLAKYLGVLPVQKGHEKYKIISQRMAKGEHKCIFEKEQDTPNATINFFYHAPLKESLRNEILVSFLKQSMEMLYTETVREDEGGAYGVPVRGSLVDYPVSEAFFQIQLPTAPDKVDRMTQIVYDGIEKLCNEGPSEDFVQKIREYLIRSHAESLKDNGYWMTQLYNKTRLGYDFVKGYDEMVQSVTAADVQKLAQKVFRSGNHTVVGMKSPIK